MSAAEKFDAKALQADLTKLGYLTRGSHEGHFGKLSQRAVRRFQRHAARIYRMSAATNSSADVTPSQAFKGKASGIPDADTLAEIKKWLENQWRLPLGRFQLKKVGDFTLREDVADEWVALRNRIKSIGGTLDGPYNSLRPLEKAKESSASSFSFHIVGRAIDIRQDFTDPVGQRYFIARDTASDARDYWRIYCKTTNQDGTQGGHYAKGDITCQSFQPNQKYALPKGYYLDLTEEIEKDGLFERIPAHGGWETVAKRAEWWHFQYVPDKQETFLDECELIGLGETDLKRAGYSLADMDHAPG